jgi:flagellar hook-associated protein 1 FlgK
LIDIRVQEQTSGAVNVYSGGDYLVFEGTARQVEAVFTTEAGRLSAFIEVQEIGARLPAKSGELSGLLAARDSILSGALDRLDSLAGTLAFEFNKLHSSGQGLRGYTSVAGEFTVNPSSQVLDAAGLAFTPVHGSFQVLVHNRLTGVTETHDVLVDLDGIDADTTLDDLAAALSAVSGLSATVDPEGRLSIGTTSPDLEFGFAQDTSGVLAALGLATFFAGSSAADLRVGEALALDPALFAAARGGFGADTDNAIELARFGDLSLASAGGATLTQLHENWITDVAQGSALARAAADGYRTFEATLRGQQAATSGVSLDEEAVRMITFQRAYQASARLIATVSELLDLLVSL